jgi:hypothetical protein
MLAKEAFIIKISKFTILEIILAIIKSYQFLKIATK